MTTNTYAQGNPFAVAPEQYQQQTVVNEQDLPFPIPRQVPQVPQQMIQFLTEDISVIGDTQSLQITSDFQNALNSIRPIISRANKLISMDINTIDDDEIAHNMKSLKEAQSMTKNIGEARKAVKNYYNKIRDDSVQELDNMLVSAGYEELIGIDKSIKKLKNDVSANRINKRWSELKSTFDANIAQYEIITRLAPKLVDFGLFRVRNEKLVSGAKTGKITDKHRKAVNDELFMIHECLTEIEKNSFNLELEYKIKLLNDFIQNPNKAVLHDRSNYYVERQQADNELRKKQEALKLQQEKERRQQEANRLTQQQPLQNAQQALPQRNMQVPTGTTMFTQTQDFARPQSTDKFPWLTELIFKDPQLKDINHNKKTKLNLLYKMFVNFGNKESIFTKETKLDPDTVIEITEYILSM